VSLVLQSLCDHARGQPRAVALRDEHATFTYGELVAQMERFASELARRNVRALGVLTDNSPAWVVTDLAAIQAGITLVPLPGFFSDAQLRHALTDAGVDAILTDQPLRFSVLGGIGPESTRLDVAGTALSLLRTQAAPCRLPAGVAKITYTSGTTGTPKGVCLSAAAMEAVAASLLEAVGAEAPQRHLSLLPLATLLENIGGVYLPLLAGTTCVVPGLEHVGLRGAAGLDAARMVGALRRYQATSAILIPQMLQALVSALDQGAEPLEHLRFLAVGGAPVSPRLLARARALGLPAYEGYGLSECASVVALNVPGRDRPGSVGRPLPHVSLRFAADGEIEVAGSLFQGYLGPRETPRDAFWPTGDIGHLDESGFLHLTGRKKNMFITSFGRNVAPEWIERELTLSPAIAQAAVFGEARPWNVAVILPRAGATRAEVEAGVRGANRELPDYARVSAWIAADEAFCVMNGQFTATGRPRRAEILKLYGARLDALYEDRHSNEELQA
jgi:long-subunit acyl-CoA synthetase (AMP-forming)